MRPNPGGQIDASDIVGRDDLVGNMWAILEGRSIYMNDLRRVGKTQDHYLTRGTDGKYAFRFALIRRWWRFDRGLETPAP